MRLPLVPITLIAALGLAGCANKGLRVIRAPGTGPDEFAVLPVKPLTAPEDYSALPAPTPGGTNLTDPTPVADAAIALGAREGALTATAVPGSDTALVAAASRYGVPANTREVVAQEDAEFRKRRGRFTGIRLFPVDRYQQAYARERIDADAQQEALRRSGVQTPTAPPPYDF